MEYTTIKSNFHTHTKFCDGRNTAEEFVQRALELGFDTLGFSGHMDAHIHMVVDDYMAELARLQSVYSDRIEILRGIELDTLYDPNCAQQADYTIGSTHYIFLGGHHRAVDHNEETIINTANEFFGGDYYALSKAYYRTEAEVYDRLKCTVIGHFDLITRFNDSLHFLDETDPRYTGPALETMEALARTGTPFEINCGALNRGRKAQPYPNVFLLKKLREFGGEVVINSDAHDIAHLNGGFDTAVRIAAECGFRHALKLTKRGTGALHFEEVPLYS